MNQTKRMTLIYVNKGNKTLFLKRAQKDANEISTGKFIGVGGKVDDTDISSYQAAIRELKEETNLTANKLIKKGIVRFIGQRDYDVITDVYLCNDFSGDLIEDNREGSLHWIDNDAIDNLNLWEGDKHFLPKLFEDGEFDITLTYKNKQLVSVTSNNMTFYEAIFKTLKGALYKPDLSLNEKKELHEESVIKGSIWLHKDNWIVSLGDEYHEDQLYITELSIPDLGLNLNRDNWTQDSQDFPILNNAQQQQIFNAIKNK